MNEAKNKPLNNPEPDFQGNNYDGTLCEMYIFCKLCNLLHFNKTNNIFVCHLHKNDSFHK